MINFFNILFLISSGAGRRYGGGRDRDERSSDFGNSYRRRNDDQYQNGIVHCFNVILKMVTLC